MLTTILTLNEWAERWLDAMAAILWQSVVLVALAALIAWFLRRSSPVVRYWLWQIVAIKLLLMPFWSFAVPLPSWAASKPVSPPAISQQSGVLGEDSGPIPLQRPLPMARDAGGEVPLPGTPFREALATISWRVWLLLAWSAVVVWHFLRLLRQRLRLGACCGNARRLIGTLREWWLNWPDNSALAVCRPRCQWPRTVRFLSAEFGGRGWYCQAD